MEEEKNKIFALVGKNISYSFSKKYFSKKFKKEQIENCKYVNFDIKSLDKLSKLIHQYKFQLKGMNVTIPYKQEIIPLLDKLDVKAVEIGAVNTIKITKNGLLKGYNTDIYGFKKSLQPLLQEHHKSALILGTGGASKAVEYVLKELGITYLLVSRNPKGKNQIGYNRLKRTTLRKYTIIINCTPLGTHPNVRNCPNIPYEFITDKHLLYDLIYNPEETRFLQLGKEHEATTKNGLEMLELQAEKAWRIWNKPLKN